MSHSLGAAARARSQGGLTSADAAACRADGIELGFDPVQQAIVPMHCSDDLADNPRGADITVISPGIARAPLSFRRWREDDAPAFVALLGNERVWTYLPDARPSLDSARAVDLIRFSNEADHHDVYAVEIAGELVGQARLLFDLKARTRDVAEISYWLGEQFWGQGIGTRLVREFTRDSFSRWGGLSSIMARVHRGNHASRGALLKAGYALEEEQPGGEWQVLTRNRS